MKLRQIRLILSSDNTPINTASRDYIHDLFIVHEDQISLEELSTDHIIDSL